jgi:phosphoesterase RecJ-like protein
VGSVLGLVSGLRQLGKACLPVCADQIPENLSFLPGVSQFVSRRPADEDLIIVLDCGGIDRIGALYDPDDFSRVPVINIDHHATNTHFGDVNLVEHQSSTAELVYGLLLGLGAEITRDVATCLLTGLSTDTRSFRTSSTTLGTIRAATVMMEAGADLADISHRVYNNLPFSAVSLWGSALQGAKMQGSIVWTEITRDTAEELDALPDVARGVVGFLSSVLEADVSAVFRENGGGDIEVELRSVPGVDVAKVAVLLGGGGHAQASGCVLPGTMENARKRVLSALDDALGQRASRTTSSTPAARAEYRGQGASWTVRKPSGPGTVRAEGVAGLL